MADGLDFFTFTRRSDDVDEDDESTSKWTKKKLTALIREYHLRPVLWNTLLPDYSSKNKRMSALSELEDIFDIPSPIIRQKINGLRTQFLAEQKKTKLSIESGGNYASRWWAFDKLKFLLLPGDPRRAIEFTNEHDVPEATEDSGLLETSDEDAKPLMTLTSKPVKDLIPFRKRRKLSEEDSSNNCLEIASVEMPSSSTRKSNINSFCRYLESEMLSVENQEQFDLFKIEVQLLLLKAKRNDLKPSFH